MKIEFDGSIVAIPESEEEKDALKRWLKKQKTNDIPLKSFLKLLKEWPYKGKEIKK